MVNRSATEAVSHVDARSTFIDRYFWVSPLLLVLIPLLVQAPFWIVGMSADPIWQYSGITQSSRLSFGYTFLDPNAGITSEALGHLAASDWLHHSVPWWNPYNGIGMPLAGELQPAAFFFPFIFLLILPAGVLWLRIVMQIISGLTMYALLRELGLSRVAALTGGALLSLCGVFAWTPGPAAVFCSLPFLPLLIWGIERAWKQEPGASSILAIGVAIAWSILAGFPEPGYIGGILALCWGIYRLIAAPHRGRMLIRTLTGFVLGICIAAPLLVAFADYVHASDSFSLHHLEHAALPWPAFSLLFLPYVYGPLAAPQGSSLLLNIWGSVGGYTSLLIVLVAVAGLATRSHRGLKFVLIFFILFNAARTFGVQPFTAIFNLLPLLDHSAVYRYAPSSWIFALTVLAAFGLDDFRNDLVGRRKPFAVVIALLLIAIVAAWPLQPSWGWSHAWTQLLFALLAGSVLWALAGLLLAAWFWHPRSRRRQIAFSCLLILDAAGMLMAAQISGARHGQIDLQAIHFLQANQGLSRTYSLGPLAPNYNAYFRIASIDHNVLPVPKLWADYADAHLLPGLLKNTDGINFWPKLGSYGRDGGVWAFSKNFESYRGLGVSYVVTNPGQTLAPEIYLPPGEAPSDTAFALGVSRTERLINMLARIGQDERKAGLVRALAKRLSGIMGRRASETIPAVTIPADSLSLKPGASVELRIAAPVPPRADSPVDQIGVSFLNATPAGGTFIIKACVAARCVSGKRSFARYDSPGFIDVPLDVPFLVPAASPLALTLQYDGGWQPLLLKRSGGSANELSIKFRYALPDPAIHEVYSDSLLDIWEIPNPAPYFQLAGGGPCILYSQNRESLIADCAASAILLRRELYMPGWHISADGATSDVNQAGIFQSAKIPSGKSRISFTFVPPHMNEAWMCFLIGLIGLLWQVLRLCTNRGLPNDWPRA